MITPSHPSWAFVAALEALSVHDHLCLIYETQEQQFAAVAPYLRVGLGRGEQCLYIADENTVGVVLEGIRQRGIDTDGALRRGSLVLCTKRETYLKQGHFDPGWMIAFLGEAVDSAKRAGFSALRVTGEMTWALGGAPGAERLIEYEAKLNEFLPENDALAICQYNRQRFDPEVLVDVIHTHPLIVYGGLVCHNPYYTPPEEFLTPGQPSLEVERLLANILDRERYESELRSSNEELEATNEQLEEEVQQREAAEARHRAFVEALPDAVLVIDEDGCIRRCTPRVESLFGYTEEELLGQPVETLIPERLRSRHRGHRGRYGSGEVAMAGSRLYRGLRKDGTEFPSEVALSPLESDEGVSTIASVRDISRRKGPEEQGGRHLPEPARRALEDCREALEEVADVARWLAEEGTSGATDRGSELAGRLWDTVARLEPVLDAVLAPARAEGGPSS